jgi:hypothetical protein
MRLREADRFSEVVARLLTTLLKRFCSAPRLARLELMLASAESIVAMAFCGAAGGAQIDARDAGAEGGRGGRIG